MRLPLAASRSSPSTLDNSTYVRVVSFNIPAAYSIYKAVPRAHYTKVKVKKRRRRSPHVRCIQPGGHVLTGGLCTSATAVVQVPIGVVNVQYKYLSNIARLRTAGGHVRVCDAMY